MVWWRETTSRAQVQRSLGPRRAEYALWPPKLDGSPDDESPSYPLEVVFDTATLREGYFHKITTSGPSQWQELLPPLAPGLSCAEGGTPLIDVTGLASWSGLDQLWVKDESRNPTGSHKDRLNLCTVSTAVAMGSPGIVVASSGNHGVSASAYAARAGIPCIIVTSNGTSPAVQNFMLAYGASVVSVPTEARQALLQRVVEESEYMPISSMTPIHTGHPFGTEGYKTIAYEIYNQLGRRAPAAVLIPTGYAELLYGIYKGFRELQIHGAVPQIPKLISCEPAARGPLARAFANNSLIETVPALPTEAAAIACTTSSYRGRLALQESRGFAIVVSDDEMREAQRASGRVGLWPEFSSAAALAGARQCRRELASLDGPIVALHTSSGFKDLASSYRSVPEIEPNMSSLRTALVQHYGRRFR